MSNWLHLVPGFGICEGMPVCSLCLVLMFKICEGMHVCSLHLLPRFRIYEGMPVCSLYLVQSLEYVKVSLHVSLMSSLQYSNTFAHTCMFVRMYLPICMLDYTFLNHISLVISHTVRNCSSCLDFLKCFS